jgi:hypothetical protein
MMSEPSAGSGNEIMTATDWEAWLGFADRWLAG